MYTKKYKIAVIIPVYNAEKYIKKCIKSFQKQTFQNFKLVLVNDGSKDKSGKICDDMAKKDERIYVIHQENKGAVEARKTGVLSQEAPQSADSSLCTLQSAPLQIPLQLKLHLPLPTKSPETS